MGKPKAGTGMLSHLSDWMCAERWTIRVAKTSRSANPTVEPRFRQFAYSYRLTRTLCVLAIARSADNPQRPHVPPFSCSWRAALPDVLEIMIDLHLRRILEILLQKID